MASQPDVPRGIRNNNPGNIRHGASIWKGLRAEQTDPEFCQFIQPIFGLRALAILLQVYAKRYGLDTVSEILSRYAPPGENNTRAYVKAVSKELDKGPDDELDMRDPVVVTHLMKAIIRHENRGQCPYEPALFREAMVAIGLLEP